MPRVADPKETQQLITGADRFLSRLLLKALHPGALAVARQLKQDYDFDGIRLVLPTTVFEERHVLDLDGTEVHLTYVGPCHQIGDTIVHVPKERVVFAGDVIFRECTPMGWNGSYEKWLKILDLIIWLDPEVIVPGHGPVCGIEGAMEMKASNKPAPAEPLLTGCSWQPLLPDAYHAACSNADQGLRLYSLRAAAAFLQTVLNLKPQQLRAVVAPFHEERLEEYRVGFTLANASEVVHGVVWPLLGAEDESTDCVGQIEAALEEAGIGSVVVLEQRFPLEFCDDCGMPMYPTPEGETSHAELPEDLPQAPAHLH